ncbi:MAG: hypothetical protein QOJ82_1893, partial [Solirubrobacteraceae bacterium]|nr:hypothetical protein [Solirubrobacteraceae bacterium]
DRSLGCRGLASVVARAAMGSHRLFLGPLLMIVFRARYPRWWFDWNRELLRFPAAPRARLGALLDCGPLGLARDVRRARDQDDRAGRPVDEAVRGAAQQRASHGAVAA